MINGVSNASGRAEGLKEGIEQGRKEGIEIGEAKGREEGILETAVSALKQGIPVETVASFTGLSVTEVEQLHRDL